jgi:transposase
MLCWITILGGSLIMMGQHSRSEALCYYFRLEDQVPETHLLRLIETRISFAFVREKLKASYVNHAANDDESCSTPMKLVESQKSLFSS